DPEAFRALMERHGQAVINLAFRFLGTVADSEDAAQEVFLRLYQHPPHLNPSGKLSTWLYRVTANLCVDFLRKPSRRARTISLEAPLSGEGEEEAPTLGQTLPDPSAVPARQKLIQRERAQGTREAIRRLPTELRVPLILSTFEELSHGQIGEILGLSGKAVERRLARARELLKVSLQPYL
ncbi:MAG: sigma-70 family RNA polymerase sigma factor, partial [Candidatus Omnitrophica bacterium]|nr:sigma-70 family RNA polymerase sigma factor [Candidatus Omnitrophota bacterium]